MEYFQSIDTNKRYIAHKLKQLEQFEILHFGLVEN